MTEDKQRVSALEILKYWQAWGFGVIAAAMLAFWRWVTAKLKRIKATQDANNEGTLALLHDRLYFLCNHHLAKGWCGVEDRNNIAMLYEAYHAMGGNGTGTDLWNRVRALPFQNPNP